MSNNLYTSDKIVSVIVPVYKTEPFLRECLDSLIEQDIGIDKIEVLIVDDCTPDNAIQIAQELANKYPQSIFIIKHDANKGLGPARNTGWGQATGKYLAFLDSDDYLDTNVFSLAIRLMEDDEDLDIFLYAYEYFSKSNTRYPLNPSGKLFPLNRTIAQYEIAQYPELMYAIGSCNKVYRKTLLDKLPSFPTGRFEDILFSIKGYLNAKHIHITDYTTYFYRKREDVDDSITDNYLETKESYFDHLAINEQLHGLIEDHPHLEYAINWLNARSCSAFMYKIMDDVDILQSHEKEELFQLIKRIYHNIDISNLYYDGVHEKTKRYINIIQKSNSHMEAVGFLNEHSENIENEASALQSTQSSNVLIKYIWDKYIPVFQKTKDQIVAALPQGINPFRKIDESCRPPVSDEERVLNDEIERLSSSVQFSQFPDNIWLFGERGDEAKDNAYAFFKYIRRNHPGVPAYYIMTKNNTEIYNKVSQLGNIIDKDSALHKIAFLKSRFLLCTHTRSMISPWPTTTFASVCPEYNNKKYIFLQHGITKDDLSADLGQQKQNFDMFITGAKPEYDYILEHFGYTEKEVKYTGFARYDNLHNIRTQRQILLMPTWRAEICQPSWVEKRSINDSTFLTSDYYKQYQALLNSRILIGLLEKSNFDLVFYPHYEVQQYLKYFSTPSSRVKIASKDSYDVQTLLKESKLLVTDYSSVFFDFAYMQKPTIFFQFDEKEFFSTHYKRGYFNYKADGFGVVCNNQNRLLYEIENVIASDFALKDKYVKKLDRFFPKRDQNNSKRIYDEVIDLNNRTGIVTTQEDDTHIRFIVEFGIKETLIAFYLYRDDTRIDIQWYSDDFSYKLYKKKYGKGKYRIRYFVVDNKEEHLGKADKLDVGLSEYREVV